jgi:hypothetical protein
MTMGKSRIKKNFIKIHDSYKNKFYKNMKKTLVLFLLLLFQIFTTICIQGIGYAYYESNYKPASHDVNYGIGVMIEGFEFIIICLIAGIVINWVKKALLIYIVFFLGYVFFAWRCLSDFTLPFGHPLQASLMLISAGIGMFVPILALQLVVKLLRRRYPENDFIKGLPFGEVN